MWIDRTVWDTEAEQHPSRCAPWLRASSPSSLYLHISSGDETNTSETLLSDATRVAERACGDEPVLAGPLLSVLVCAPVRASLISWLWRRRRPRSMDSWLPRVVRTQLPVPPALPMLPLLLRRLPVLSVATRRSSTRSRCTSAKDTEMLPRQP